MMIRFQTIGASAGSLKWLYELRMPMKIPAIPMITTVGNMIRMRCTVRLTIAGSLLNPGATTLTTCGAKTIPMTVTTPEDDRGQDGDGVGHLPGLPAALLLKQPGEHRDEGRGERGVGQQGPHEAGDLVGDGEGAHGGPKPEVRDHDDLADEAEHPGAGGRQHEEGGRCRQTFLGACVIAHVRGLC